MFLRISIVLAIGLVVGLSVFVVITNYTNTLLYNCYMKNAIVEGMEINFYSKAIHLKPDDVVARRNRGSAYFYYGKLDEAIADYTRAIRLQPNDEELYLERSMIYTKKRELNKVLLDINEAIRINPKSAQAYAFRAFYFHGIGESDKAIIDFEKAFNISTDFKYASQACDLLGWLKQQKQGGAK